MSAVGDAQSNWAKLKHYRRLYYLGALLLALMLLLLSVRPDLGSVAGSGATVAVILMLWAVVQVGSRQCPHCRYPLRSIDALYWKRCRHCRQSLRQGAA